MLIFCEISINESLIIDSLCCCTTSDLLRVLSVQMKDAIMALPGNTTLLERWKVHHAMVARLIHQLNQTFGVILLTAIGSAFVAFIANTFSLVTSMQAGQAVFSLSFIIFLTKHSLRLTWIISSSYLLKCRVMDVSLNLRQFQFPCSDLKLQIKVFHNII